MRPLQRRIPGAQHARSAADTGTDDSAWNPPNRVGSTTVGVLMTSCDWCLLLLICNLLGLTFALLRLPPHGERRKDRS